MLFLIAIKILSWRPCVLTCRLIESIEALGPAGRRNHSATGCFWFRKRLSTASYETEVMPWGRHVKKGNSLMWNRERKERKERAPRVQCEGQTRGGLSEVLQFPSHLLFLSLTVHLPGSYPIKNVCLERLLSLVVYWILSIWHWLGPQSYKMDYTLDYCSTKMLSKRQSIIDSACFKDHN